MKLGNFSRRCELFAKSYAIQFALVMLTWVTSFSGIFDSQAVAQFLGSPFAARVGVVGGVKIDVDGFVRDVSIAEQQEFMQAIRGQFHGAPAELKRQSDLRMISLKDLQATIAEHKSAGNSLPEDVLFLGGMTRIEYVFVYPEQNDIVIAGPAEGWVVGKNGSFVGEKSGKAILYLDDLLTAFQTVNAARMEGISCSIEPTAEGSKRLSQLQSQLAPGSDPRPYEKAMQDAFGPQNVLLKGVTPDSHMARVILAADYQMKRYGMNLAEAPVKGLTSYLETIPSRSARVPQSRWWMACDYDPVERSEDGLAWKIGGRGIKTLTEAEMIDAQGNRKQSGKTDGLAQKWADTFTAKMPELAVQDPVFAELRNIMDLCVLAALVESQGLGDLSHCDLSVLRGQKHTVELAKLGTPKHLPAQCSFLKVASGWVVTASGGVQIDSWAIASNVKLNEKMNGVQVKGKPTNSKAWWWN